MTSSQVLIIGGSSHSGKTTLAKALSKKWNCRYISTDGLARHPGRPWPKPSKPVPVHVANHYRLLPLDELLIDVLAHYEKLQPEIKEIIQRHLIEHPEERLIVEGSAIWPAFTHSLLSERVNGIWLTAKKQVFKGRIFRESDFEQADELHRALILKFLKRTILYNEEMMKIVERERLVYFEFEKNLPGL